MMGCKNSCFTPERKAIQISLAADWEPFGELIKNPGEGKPDLTGNRGKPETNCIMDWVHDSITEENCYNHKPSNNHHSVRIYQTRCYWHFS